MFRKRVESVSLLAHGTLVTDSVLVADAVRASEGITLHLLGGRYRHASGTVAGPVAVEQLGRLSLDVAFLSASAVSRGWICHTFPEDAPIAEAMVVAARQTWLLVDATKFDAPAVGQIMPIGAVHGLVTDADDDAVRAAGVPDAVEVLRV